MLFLSLDLPLTFRKVWLFTAFLQSVCCLTSPTPFSCTCIQHTRVLCRCALSSGNLHFSHSHVHSQIRNEYLFTLRRLWFSFFALHTSCRVRLCYHITHSFFVLYTFIPPLKMCFVYHSIAHSSPPSPVPICFPLTEIIIILLFQECGISLVFSLSKHLDRNTRYK